MVIYRTAEDDNVELFVDEEILCVCGCGAILPVGWNFREDILAIANESDDEEGLEGDGEEDEEEEDEGESEGEEESDGEGEEEGKGNGEGEDEGEGDGEETDGTEADGEEEEEAEGEGEVEVKDYAEVEMECEGEADFVDVEVEDEEAGGIEDATQGVKVHINVQQVDLFLSPAKINLIYSLLSSLCTRCPTKNSCSGFLALTDVLGGFEPRISAQLLILMGVVTHFALRSLLDFFTYTGFLQYCSIQLFFSHQNNKI